MNGPPLSLLTWLLAAAPILVLLLLMMGLRWGGERAGLVGWLAAGLIAALFFGAGWKLLLLSSLRGLILSLDVLYIIWPSLVLFHLVEEAGAIQTIARGIGSLSRDPVILLLMLGYAFPSFLQAVAGFGMPVAVAAPLLIGLGFPATQATLVPLVGHAWAVSLGSLASSFQALRAVTGLPGHELGLWLAGLLGVCAVATGFIVAHICGGFEGIRRCLVAILVLGIGMAGVQWLLAFWDYWIIASFAAGLAGMVLGVLLARFGGRGGAQISDLPAEFHLAFAPYYLLILVVGAATLIPPVQRVLDAVVIAIPFPALRTAQRWVTAPTVQHLAVLGHPGALITYACPMAWALYRWKGAWPQAKRPRILRRTVEGAWPSTLAIVSMIMMATVMTVAGMTFLLARGTVGVAGRTYPFLAPFVGLLGCFLTGSNTTSNVLFGAFQRDAATLLELNPSLMSAVHSTGGALGSMVTPAKVLIACATAGLRGREGRVMARAFPYCLGLTALVGLMGWGLMAFLPVVE